MTDVPDEPVRPQACSAVRRWAWVPIPVLLVAVVGVWAADLQTPHEAPYLLTGLNLIFMVAPTLLVALVMGAVFLTARTPDSLLTGCGALVLGLAGPAANISALLVSGHDFDVNVTATIHAVCVWIATQCLLAGAACSHRWAPSLPSPRRWLAVGCALALGLVGGVVTAVLCGLTPVFFVQGVGGTTARQFVLGSAIVGFLLTVALLRPMRRGDASDFGHWYGLSLLLLAVGYLAVTIQPIQGGVLGWTGRATQFLGGCYLCVAAVAAARGAGPLSITLGRPREDVPHVLGVAIAIALAAAVLRMVFLRDMGTSFGFLTFYPAVALAALYGGLWAGVSAAILSAVLADYFWIEPVGSFQVAHVTDLVAIGVFLLCSAMISMIVERMIRADARARKAEAMEHDHLERLVRDRTEDLRREVARGRRLEDDLRAKRERLRLFVDGVPAGIAMFDTAMRYVAVSRRFAEDYGAAADDLIGRRHYDVFPDISERWRDIHRRCLGGETLRCEEDPFPRADGHLDWVRWEVRPWHSAPDRIGGIIIFAEKITERKAIEAALHAAKAAAERANDAKTRFMASVSHDLRQPLQAQRFLLYNVARKAEHPDQVRKACEQMEKTLEATETMLSRLSDFAALESGNVAVKREAFRLDRMIADIVRENGDEAAARGLTLRVRTFPCLTESDAVLLGRIVRNLISNALRYTARGGILVGVRRRGAHLRIEVRDTGIGIPADQRQVIFEEFRQLDNPERNRAKGHGLGLAIVTKTAELLGHRLFLRSTVGRGSVFAVEVPRTGDPIPSAAAAAVEVPHHRRATTILVVEDDPMQADALASLLSGCGYRVLVARDGAEAAAAIPPPDLILSDYRLPGGQTGVDAVGRVRTVNGGAIPAIIMTGDTEAAIALDVARADCDIVHKPCPPSALFAAIARLVPVPESG